MLVSQVQAKLELRLGPIQTIVKLCPMLGLLGTVTGMIEVFDVMAVAGSGNARGMAAGVSKATLPTMAGMVASISGMLFSIQLSRFAVNESERVADNLETGHM
jgi:biopolymer transport protein ExbB